MPEIQVGLSECSAPQAPRGESGTPLVSCLSNLSNDGRKSGATNCEPLYYICRCNRHCCYSYLRDTTLASPAVTGAGWP